MARERAALPLFAGDFELRAVPLQGVLDDREPEPGASQLARTARVDTIKALGESRDVRSRDTDARVRDRDVTAEAVCLVPH